MSLKIYSSNSPDIIFVQPDARNQISVAELNNKFNDDVVALEVLTSFNEKQRITPRKTGHFCRNRGWWASKKRNNTFKSASPTNLIFYLNGSTNFTNDIPITKKGTISLKNVEKMYQKKVVALKFTQGSSEFLLTPKTKKKRFKLPNLNWQEPFDVEPIYGDIDKVVQVHADNGKAARIPLQQNGNLKLDNTLFGRDVQVLHITYQNTVYRHNPITRNVFKEPYCSWKRCSYIKAILVKPIVRESFVDYGSISDEYQWEERSLTLSDLKYFDDVRYGWNSYDVTYHKKKDEKPMAKRCSWKLWFFITALVFLVIGGVVYIWRAEIHAQLMLFVNSLPQIRDKVESGWSAVKLFVADKIQFLGTLF
uniref:Inner membrane protein oxaA n=1 Tax=Panagrellus redivivus TaxID=6233 RepID=A0A7E4V0Z0_PANRE